MRPSYFKTLSPSATSKVVTTVFWFQFGFVSKPETLVYESLKIEITPAGSSVGVGAGNKPSTPQSADSFISLYSVSEIDCNNETLSSPPPKIP